MSETRKIAAILVADVVGYSRLAGADEDRILGSLRALRSDLLDPTVALHHGRVVKRTGDGTLIEFRSVVAAVRCAAVRCAIEVQNGMAERNAGLPPERRIEFRMGIHLGDVVEEADGDLMGDGVNIAARLEGICAPHPGQPEYRLDPKLPARVADCHHSVDRDFSPTGNAVARGYRPCNSFDRRRRRHVTSRTTYRLQILCRECSASLVGNESR
jgi:Adenylate and Guanylate cyclase catalytic domain